MINRPSLEYLKTRIHVDCDNGRVYWKNPTKYHPCLLSNEAGCSAKNTNKKKSYWYVKVDSQRIKRSYLVFLFSTGEWPSEQIDHINGNSLDDRRGNIRLATPTQNAWNHKTRKKLSSTPMGVRELKSGRFQARIAVHKRQLVIGTFDSVDEASNEYQKKRKELFNDYA